MIRVKDITVSYGGLRALDSVDFTLPAIGTVGLIGPNASGKSTLLDLLSGFIKCDSGEVYSSSRSLSPKILSDLTCRLHQRLVIPENIIVEDYLLICQSTDSLSLLDVINPLWISGRKPISLPQKINQLIKVAQIDLNRKIGEHSLGQKRIIAILAAIVTNKILLLDEPFAGLSWKMINELKAVIKLISQSKLVVIVEHDLESVKHISEQLIILVSGKVVALHESNIEKVDLLEYFV